jgi:alpha-ketoglutarate-dependent taurine dioxygenase
VTLSIQLQKPFGARILNMNCAELSSAVLDKIGQLLAQHELLIFPGQQHLSPAEEANFYKSLAPSANTVWRDQLNNPWEVHKVAQGNTAGTWQVPGVPAVLVIGKGRYTSHGLDVELGGARGAYGSTESSQVLGGGKLQWHIDGAFYLEEPCRVGQMRCIEAPSASDHWIDYDEEPQDGFTAVAGATVFASGRKALELLGKEQIDDLRKMQVHYAPHPFQRAQTFINSSNGLKVSDPDSQPENDDIVLPTTIDSNAKVYPLVWRCPLTSKPALMIHPRCLQYIENWYTKKLYSEIESRNMAEQYMRPAVSPQHLVIHNWKSGDLVVWNNYSVWHSATGGLNVNDRRVMHLTAFNGITPPEPG